MFQWNTITIAPDGTGTFSGTACRCVYTPALRRYLKGLVESAKQRATPSPFNTHVYPKTWYVIEDTKTVAVQNSAEAAEQYMTPSRILVEVVL